MARRVFFSFAYEDVSRAMVVRNSGVLQGTEAAGFIDAAEFRKIEAVVIQPSNDGLMSSSMELRLRSYWSPHPLATVAGSSTKLKIAGHAVTDCSAWI